MLDFSGQVAVVTGAAGGIGSATVHLLARLGASVIAADIHEAGALAAVASLPGPGKHLAIGLDIASEAAVRTAIAQAVATYGRLDILINNAAALGPDMGPQFDRDVETTAMEVWDKAYQVNLRGTVLMCKYALPHLVASGEGAIVNVASNLALQGNVVQNAYSASKAAVIQLTRCIAASHGRRNIRANCVLPGLTMTPIVRTQMPAAHRQAVFDENLLPEPGTPEDLARAICFLASRDSRNITANILVSDAGNSSHVPGFAQIAEVEHA